MAYRLQHAKTVRYDHLSFGGEDSAKMYIYLFFKYVEEAGDLSFTL